MSLREEITKNLHLLILRYDADGEDRINIEGTSIAIINKVLDAAYEEIAPIQTYTYDGMKVKDEVIAKLNKLRVE